MKTKTFSRCASATSYDPALARNVMKDKSSCDTLCVCVAVRQDEEEPMTAVEEQEHVGFPKVLCKGSERF